MSNKTFALLSAAAAAAAWLPASAFGGGHPAGALGRAHSAGGHTVTVAGLRFHPGTLRIKRGDSVTWQWHGREREHNVTFRSFHSRTGSSGSYTVRFTRSGTFPYVCTIHVSEGMKGKVIVR